MSTKVISNFPLITVLFNLIKPNVLKAHKRLVIHYSSRLLSPNDSSVKNEKSLDCSLHYVSFCTTRSSRHREKRQTHSVFSGQFMKNGHSTMHFMIPYLHCSLLNEDIGMNDSAVMTGTVS